MKKSRDMEYIGKAGRSLGSEVGKLFLGRVRLGTKGTKRIIEGSKEEGL